MATIALHVKEGTDPKELLGRCTATSTPRCARPVRRRFPAVIPRNWTGGPLCAKPKVRQIITLLEVTHSGYVKIRPAVLLWAEKLQANGNRRRGHVRSLAFKR